MNSIETNIEQIVLNTGRIAEALTRLLEVEQAVAATKGIERIGPTIIPASPPPALVPDAPVPRPALPPPSPSSAPVSPWGVRGDEPINTLRAMLTAALAKVDGGLRFNGGARRNRVCQALELVAKGEFCRGCGGVGLGPIGGSECQLCAGTGRPAAPVAPVAPVAPPPAPFAPVATPAPAPVAPAPAPIQQAPPPAAAVGTPEEIRVAFDELQRVAVLAADDPAVGRERVCDAIKAHGHALKLKNVEPRFYAHLTAKLAELKATPPPVISDDL